MTYAWWLYPVAVLAIHIVTLESRLRRAASRGTTLVFSGSFALKIMFGSATVILSILLYMQGAKTEWWIDLIAVCFVICFLFGWPKTIVTDNLGVKCVWWWRPSIFIPWSQVEDAEMGRSGSILVIGQYANITFEAYHPDATGFRRQITSKSKARSIRTPRNITELNL